MTNNSNNNAYKRMLEEKLKGISLDDLLAGKTEAQPPALIVPNTHQEIKKINHTLNIEKRNIEKRLNSSEREILPELPSEFERILLFSPPFESWKPFGQGAIVKVANILYSCSVENSPAEIFAGDFKYYYGYGRGALAFPHYSTDEFISLKYTNQAYLCPLPPAKPFNIRFPNDGRGISFSNLLCWAGYNEGIIGVVGKPFSTNLVAYSDKKSVSTIAKLKSSNGKITLFQSGEGAIVCQGTRFTLYREAKQEGIELYTGGWSEVRSWNDDLLVRIGRNITQYSAGKESKLLYSGEGTDWVMTGCGLLVVKGDSALHLKTEKGENFSFKGDTKEIAGYPSGMLIEDETKQLWAIRRKRD